MSPNTKPSLPQGIECTSLDRIYNDLKSTKEDQEILITDINNKVTKLNGKYESRDPTVESKEPTCTIEALADVVVGLNINTKRLRYILTQLDTII